jgi:ribosomal protein S25
MPKNTRLAAIKKLEEVRKSRVVTYLTADRGIVHLAVAEDVLRIMYRHLQAIGSVEKLDLFVYSRGGDTHTPWPLVSVSRHFGKEFNVLVPYRAHSAATQIAMGADQIVMGPMGELTQVDPSLSSDFTPANPLQAGQTLYVSVEDLRGYFEFFEDSVKAPETSWPAVIDLLREKLHPLAIGQVHRAHGSIQYIAESLLGTHIKDEETVKRIAKAMVTELYVHSHKIKQPEADKIGLPAVPATQEEAEAMWALYELYEADMHLNDPIKPQSIFKDKMDQYVELREQPMVFVESSARTDVFKMNILATRTLAGSMPQKVQLSPAAAGGAAPPQRPIWTGNIQFQTELEWWTTE